MVVAGSVALTVMISGRAASIDTGARSLKESYGSFWNSAGPIPWVVMEFCSRV